MYRYCVQLPGPIEHRVPLNPRMPLYLEGAHVRVRYVALLGVVRVEPVHPAVQGSRLKKTRFKLKAPPSSFHNQDYFETGWWFRARVSSLHRPTSCAARWSRRREADAAAAPPRQPCCDIESRQFDQLRCDDASAVD